MQKEVDVVVVGGGISGLTAAYQLHRKNPSLRINVLEAKDRVGGRTLTLPLKTVNGTDKWDLGGQWVGRCQPHIMAMLEELGLETHCQYIEGTKLMQLGDDKIRSYKSEIPSLSLFALLDLHRILQKIENMKDMVDVNDPFQCEFAREWDSMTVQTFLNKHVWTEGARDAIDASNRCMFGAESSQMSVLYFLMYAKAAGNFDNLIKATEYRGQEYRIKGGAQQISEILAKKIGNKSVLLNQPVTKIEQSESHVLVHATNGDVYKCDRVIIATPPNQTKKIQFDPALPPNKREIMKRMPISYIIKIIVTFKETFWRSAGQSGEVVTNGGPCSSDGCDKGPLCIIYDATSAFGSPALVGFIGGKAAVQWGRKPIDERKSAVLMSLAEFFGPEVWSYLDYQEKDWGTEPYTEGGPVCCVTPGAMEYIVAGLRHPYKRIHFAGTESATVWCGFMNGAVQAGIRAANEVMYHIRPQSVSALELSDTAYGHTINEPPMKKSSKLKSFAKISVGVSVVLLTVAFIKKRFVT